MPRARQTTEFQTLWNQVKAAAIIRKQAAELRDALADAIAELEEMPCRGSRLRGPRLNDICEWRLPPNRKFRAWRLLYRVQQPQKTPVLLLLGEHYLPIDSATYKSPPHPKNRLGVRLRIADPYLTLAHQLNLSDAEFKQLLIDLQKPQKACC